MNIYHLSRQEQIRREENSAIVLIAENQAEARSRAADYCGAEGPSPWLTDADITELGTANPGLDHHGFVCIDYFYA